ncbi:hypothetical protein V1281_005924 [Nitrobacteraceae bacterium AZCC 2161]
MLTILLFFNRRADGARPVHSIRSRFARIYRAMREAGKPAKLALIAVARKLLVTLNAVVRDQQPFHP